MSEWQVIRPPRASQKGHRLPQRSWLGLTVVCLMGSMFQWSSAAAAGSGCVDEAVLDRELRQLCEIVAEGIRRLPGDAQLQRIAVLQFSGPDEGSRARASRRVLGDRLAGECLADRHRLPVWPDIGPVPENGALDAVRSAVDGMDVQVVVTGELTRSPDGYAASVRVIELASGSELVSSMRMLPAEELEQMSTCRATSRRGAALLRSAAFPGWGQIYNGEVLAGSLLASLEAALLVGALSAEVAGRVARERYERHSDDPAFVTDNAEARRRFDQRTLLLGIAGGVWIYAMVDAYLGGYEYRPTVAPRVGFGPGSATVDWSWRF